MDQASVGSTNSPQTNATATIEVQRAQAQQRLDELIRQKMQSRIEIAQRPEGDAVTAQMEKMLAVMDEQINLAAYEVERLSRPNTSVSAVSTAPGLPNLPAIPNEYVVLSTLFLLVAVLPVSLAFARRIWRRHEPSRVALAPELEQRLETMQMAVDSMATEVERIGEGQRYVTGLLSAQLGGVSPEARPQMPEAVAKRELQRAVTPH
ncbi:MAG: hypothetical protein IBJ03_10905 [Gemmatimonadaceae bacterium]|nr:hypothetical protein [Gemmatimonadaceae bacterium]